MARRLVEVSIPLPFDAYVKSRCDRDESYSLGRNAFFAKKKFQAPVGVIRRQSWYDGYLDAKYPEGAYDMPLCDRS